jgi:hypothetical protein
MIILERVDHDITPGGIGRLGLSWRLQGPGESLLMGNIFVPGHHLYDEVATLRGVFSGGLRVESADFTAPKTYQSTNFPDYGNCTLMCVAPEVATWWRDWVRQPETMEWTLARLITEHWCRNQLMWRHLPEFLPKLVRVGGFKDPDQAQSGRASMAGIMESFYRAASLYHHRQAHAVAVTEAHKPPVLAEGQSGLEPALTNAQRGNEPARPFVLRRFA